MYKRSPKDGLHIIIEGIDGSGKSTVLGACRSWAENLGHTFFDVVSFTQTHNRLPTTEELGSSTALITAEPTFCWVGSAIRDEIIAKHTDDTARYSGLETAQAFAMDRLVQYRRLVIPFLKNHPDRLVIQDRSAISSVAYQPLQDPTLATSTVLSLPGNVQAVLFNPSLALLIRTPAAAAAARLNNRTDKQDDCIFENLDFQTQLAVRYLSDEVLDPFRDGGMKIVEINGNLAQKEVAESVIQELSQNLGDFAKLRAST